jgi:tRNA A37 threonylcarbamoyladenosine dehydratase
MDEFERLRALISDKFDLIKTKKVLVVGLGGVGGYAVEALVRSGISDITIVDYDVVDITNINRQIIALHSTIGKYKTEVFKNRINDINPDCSVTVKNMKIDDNNINSLFEKDYDYVVDACDTISVKKELIRICLRKNIKLISSMGTAKKLDPTKLEIVDVRKTSYDPIAKIIRKMVKEEKISKKVWVISSTEKPVDTKDNVLGSTAFVPSTAGLLCAKFIINDIIK